jgi:hypothetical protein
MNLIKAVIDHSNGKTWSTAVLEWRVIDCEEDDLMESSCLCGKENLRYLFTINNFINGNTLYPIGSSCIKKFKRSDLNDIVSIREQLFKLLHAIESDDYISLSHEYFSRKLILYLYESDAFKPNKYNRYDPKNDFQFLLDMFNKKDKASITLAQNEKISAIILKSIKPFLKTMLQNRVKVSSLVFRI